MRILLVEDEAKVSSFVARGLTEERFAVDVAADGKAGLDLAMTYHYDLVVLDLMLPTLDGTQVLRRLRAENVQIPVLILTARDAVADPSAAVVWCAWQIWNSIDWRSRS